MEAEDGGTPLNGVVVGQQRVVGRVDHCPSDSRSGPRDDQHPCRGRCTGDDREQGPHGCAGQGDEHAVAAIGPCGDRHLQRQCKEGRERHECEDSAVRHVEGIADIRQKDPEGGAVQFVDAVQAEQHQQRKRRRAAGQLSHRSPRMAEPAGPAPQGERGAERGAQVAERHALRCGFAHARTSLSSTAPMISDQATGGSSPGSAPADRSMLSEVIPFRRVTQVR